MKRITMWLSVLFLFATFVCFAAAQTKNGSGGSATHERMKNKSGQPLDPAVVEKVKTTFDAVFNNDDKKAKLLYGRNYKFMPEVVQFALDIRFKNFEHALTVLPNAGESQGETAFWQSIVNEKPTKFAAAVCKKVLAQTDFPTADLSPTQVEVDWNNQLKVEDTTSEKTLSELNKGLSVLVCGPDDKASCEPLNEVDQKTFFSESYFDKVHNFQRRDTAFVNANYRNAAKITSYKRYITVENIFKIFRAMNATEHSRKDHFLRRIKGIGRDIRIESISARLVGDEILDDTKDLQVAARLRSLINANPILTKAINLDYELASCGLNNNKSGGLSKHEKADSSQ
jgi:hypothetical protein